MTPLHGLFIWLAIITAVAYALRPRRAKRATPYTDRYFLHLRSMMQDCRTYDELCNVKQVMIDQLPRTYHRYTLAIFYGQYWKIVKTGGV